MPDIARERVESWRSRMQAELQQNVVPFWMQHSLDRENGGYFNCLDRDGRRFDTKKHVWLQGRQVWMLSKLCGADPSHADPSRADPSRADPSRADPSRADLSRADLSRADLSRADSSRVEPSRAEPSRAEPSRADLLDAATLGARFLREHARREDDRVYFSLTRAGAPLALQRKIFAECFYVLAFAEYARASGDDSYRELALSELDAILRWIDDPTPLGRPRLRGQIATSELAVPMILLNLVSEVRGAPGSPTFRDREDYDRIEARCVASIRRHFDRERGLVFETIGADGSRLDSPEGRLINPGHVIECGWFLLDHARRVQDRELTRDALAMIDGALELGWDREHGGILYFLDSEGFSPQQLEWSMKLWWPHCEALVALLMAWRETGEARWFERFETVADWTFDHFPDPAFGEWFGYLDRRGVVSQRFKGGPYKGCFHVPRALFLCERELRAALELH